jgi:uncharacterized protein
MTPMAFISGLSPAATDRLLSVSCTDKDGNHSDSCDIKLDDRDGLLEIPEKGRIITIQLGYLQTGLVLMGRYTVDTVSCNGWPRAMSISGKAADMREGMKQPRTEAHEKKTIGDIVGKIAARHGLQPFVSDSLKDFKYDYIAASEESDMNFLTRIARRHDALFAPKNGKMMFVRCGEGKSMTGLDIPSVIIRGPGSGGIPVFALVPGDVIDYQASADDRSKHGKTKSSHYDRKKGKREFRHGKSTAGVDYQTRHPHPNKAEADAEAAGKGKELERSLGSLSLTVIGDPGLASDLTATVIGVRSFVDGEWRIKSATHTLDTSGYKTKLQCEKPNSKDAKSSESGSASDGAAGGATSTPSPMPQASYPVGGI